MSNPHARNNNTDLLHPMVRKAVLEVEKQLKDESIPFKIFEAYRFPQRQADLYAQGRTKPGSVVTKAKPWHSYHQYGLAVDFVLFENGNWSWDDSTPSRKGWWKRLHELGAKQGLERLSFETPHLQIAGTSSNDLIHGNYPLGGDDFWSENLASAIASWSGSPSSPQAPSVPTRPELLRRFKVTASNGLRVRKGPGISFDIVTELHLGEVVYVSSREHGWARVDINGDGDAEGFVSASYLVEADV